MPTMSCRRLTLHFDSQSIKVPHCPWYKSVFKMFCSAGHWRQVAGPAKVVLLFPSAGEEPVKSVVRRLHACVKTAVQVSQSFMYSRVGRGPTCGAGRLIWLGTKRCSQGSFWANSMSFSRQIGWEGAEPDRAGIFKHGSDEWMSHSSLGLVLYSLGLSLSQS